MAVENIVGPIVLKKLLVMWMMQPSEIDMVAATRNADLIFDIHLHLLIILMNLILITLQLNLIILN